jgi:hypothetical protein
MSLQQFVDILMKFVYLDFKFSQTQLLLLIIPIEWML